MDLLQESISNVITSGNINFNDPSLELNIAYGIDRNFLFGAAVSMQSIAMYNKELSLRFHLFTDYIDDDYIARVNKFTQSNPNVEVNIYTVSRVFIDIFPSLKQWSYATFFRFIAFQVLSDNVEKVLYIDADVICKGSLSGLLDISFEDEKYAAVIRDIPFMQGKPAERLNVPGLPGNYFNAGVVYLLLKAWKDNDFMNKAIAMLASDPEHKKYKCLDQDILNILFFNHCIFISSDYDCFYGVDYELKNSSNEDYKKTITEDTKLIHYVGVTKPWHDWVNYPCQIYFNDAYKISFWNDVSFLSAMDERQFEVKYQHEWKNGRYLSAIKYFIKARCEKFLRKYFR
ncbi:glycosyltransferase family 8 protein [Leminorella grimontii]|uniref:glycosyltransferase family 8 protein n=1 Tax=Leminorella grimontii TaxID=82981 RepID=UPI00208088E1|nr:glycosyltransferase [Leminorella grimontii]GKX60926.1 UDP-galactose--(galactosyl) LPS alpha1,2-galactosyltransferase [Leminorella grimontii]